MEWHRGLGIRPDKLRFRQHGPKELAHYARGAFDIEYEFPFGWSELEGIAARGNYDLTEHQRVSGKDLSYFDDLKRERYIPHVVEPSVGVDRSMLTVLLDAYNEEEVRGEQRTVLRLHHAIATTVVFLSRPIIVSDSPSRAFRSTSCRTITLARSRACFAASTSRTPQPPWPSWSAAQPAASWTSPSTCGLARRRSEAGSPPSSASRTCASWWFWSGSAMPS